MTKDRLDGLINQVEIQLRRASSQVSLETKRYATSRLAEITPQLERVSRENAYQDYLLDHLQAEGEKFQLYTEFRDSNYDEQEQFLDDQFYDELRENPVCTCDGPHGHRCPLKRRKLPWEVRNADSIDDGIREFKANHAGRPLVLLDAQEEFAGLVGEVEQDLRNLVAAITSDEIPEQAQTATPKANGQHSDD